MLRIAISGKLASGKSTAASALINQLRFLKVALADELKAIAADIAIWMHRNRLVSHNDRISLLDKATPVGRRYLQWLGTDCLRKRDPGIWIRMLLQKIESQDFMGYSVVTDDARFLNEFEGLRRAGFLLLKAELPEDRRLERVRSIYPNYDMALAMHPSETQLESWHEWDFVFRTDQPIEQTQKDVVGWVSSRMARMGRATLSGDVVQVSASQESA